MLRYFAREGKVSSASYMGFTSSLTQPGAPLSPYSCANSFLQTRRSATIKFMFYNSLRLLKYDQHNKTESWKIRNKRRQYRFVRTVERFLNTTARSSTVVLIIG